MTKEISVATRNILALRGLGTMAPRGLERIQERHPDHRFFSSQGMPFPCPSNGSIKTFNDIDFRSTGPRDIPEGMEPMEKREGYPKTRAKPPLGKSKWDFQYMKSGSSFAVRIEVNRHSELYDYEANRIRNIGITMWRYQKKCGYISSDFLIQTSIEEISIGKLKNGDDILALHVVFWRIDGTRIDPNFQGAQG